MFCSWLNLTGDTMSVWDELHAVYTQPWRAYHNLAHIDDCLLMLSLYFDLDEESIADEIEAAIWFHDAIYEVGATDNEERSAQLARKCLTSLGAPADFIERVAELIITTDHQRPARDAAARLLCDIDLSILGRHADVYDRYAGQIAVEVGLPEDEFMPHRQTFLRNMLSKEHIFHTDRFRQEYEIAARANMRRELEDWAKKPAQ